MTPNHKMPALALITVLLVLAASCNNNQEQQTTAGETERKVNQPINQDFVADTIFLTDEFGDFESPFIQEGLAELLICDVYVDTVEKLVLPCDPRFFRAFPLKPNGNYADGFIVDVKPGVIPGSTTRRFFTIVKNREKWRLTNDLKGTLLELRTTPTGNWDLVIRYTHEKTQTKVAVLHRFNENERAFLPETVTEINDRFINTDFKDSLNKVYLTNFIWGF
jgi:hypothetical protein